MFNRLTRVSVGLLFVITLSACGQSATTGGGMEGMEGMEMDMTAMAGGMEGMEMDATATAGGMEGMEMDATATAGGMEGMEMDATATAGAMGGMEMSSAPFDAQFIDSMIVHHNGAITMAQQALTESERPEIKELAQNIISSQQQEVDRMTTWRKEWYPDLEPTSGMMPMGDMEVSSDTSIPFDQRFITAMIAHHQAAIEMAKEAQTKAERAEIKELAGEIITAQEAEIAQMQAWEEEWFGS